MYVGIVGVACRVRNVQGLKVRSASWKGETNSPNCSAFTTSLPEPFKIETAATTKVFLVYPIFLSSVLRHSFLFIWFIFERYHEEPSVSRLVAKPLNSATYLLHRQSVYYNMTDFLDKELLSRMKINLCIVDSSIFNGF